jgi:hypothetical protein
MASKKLRSKPKLSVRDKATLRRIMKTVRNIRIWQSQHGK